MIHPWFASPWLLWLMALLPALTLLAFFAQRKRRRILARFGRLPILMGLTEGPQQWPFLRRLCLEFGLLAIILGSAGPQWGRETQVALVPGRDLIVVVDLSRSMLADDAPPNRLGRAKEGLNELSQAVQRRGGHRLGLVVFAAHAKVVCPLTHDYDHFREKVAELDALHLPPDLRAGKGDLSGTRIGAGIFQAVQAHDLDPKNRGFQDILLLSDGDDPADDQEWDVGILEALGSEIPVHTVGIGDPKSGGRIPLADGVLEYAGQIVVSRLHQKPLQDIARRTGGAYLPAQTGPIRLGDFFHERIQPLAEHEIAADTVPVYRQRYPWFFAAALGFLALEMVIGRRQVKIIPKPRGESSSPAGPLVPKLPQQ